MSVLFALYLTGIFVQLLVLVPMLLAAPAEGRDLRHWAIAAVASPLWPVWVVLIVIDFARDTAVRA